MLNASDFAVHCVEDMQPNAVKTVNVNVMHGLAEVDDRVHGQSILYDTFYNSWTLLDHRRYSD